MKAVVLAAPAALALLVTVPVVGCSSSEGDESSGRGCVDETTAPLRLCAKGPTLEGIDVSVWQGDVDWAKVKESGRAFAFARVSNGLLKPDTKFAANWPGMKKAGLVRGAYQYFRPGQDPKAQAQALLDAIEAAGGLDAGDLPPVIDVETTDDQPPAVVQANAKAWLDHVETKVGRKPIVYTASFMSPVIGQALVDYPLWVANYTTECPLVPEGWTSWRFWQRTDKGTVSGISGPVDLNTFDGTLADLGVLTLACKPRDVACAAGAAGVPEPAPPPPPPTGPGDEGPPPAEPCAP